MITIDDMYTSQAVPDILLNRIRTQQGDGNKLDLSLCNLVQVPLKAIREYFGEPVSFDLSFNSIRYLSPEFAVDMKNLSRLDLSRNDLRKLPENFGDMRELLYLDLHQNKLETLPISMGKMTRLKFLSISDNPFRAPLSNFFGQGALGREVSGVALADLVIKLLAEMSTEISESGDISQESFLHSRNSKVHYTEKSITGFEEETGDVSSNSSDSSNDLALDLDNENNLVLRHSHPKTKLSKKERKSTKLKRRKLLSMTQALTANPTVTRSGWVWGKMRSLFTFIFVFGLFLPLIMSVAIDASYFDRWAQDSGSELFASFWSRYKPYHETMDVAIRFSSRFVYKTLRIRGPYPDNVDDGIFTSLYNYLASVFNYIGTVFGCII